MNGKSMWFDLAWFPSLLTRRSMKLSGEQYDDRIIEVHWDPSTCHWRMMRFRDDKPYGNHKSVVDKIISSISDGIEKAEVDIEKLRVMLSTKVVSACCALVCYSCSLEEP